jgi:hypothetical protein
MPLNCVYFPANDGSRFVHSSCIATRYSSVTAPRSANGTPSAALSAATHPAPIPNTNRPPLNATVEIGGPEAIPLDELAREVLSAKGDSLPIVEDRHARYYGAELDDESLIPGPKARIGSLKFGDWLQQSMTAH